MKNQLKKNQPNLDLFLRNYDNSEDDNEDKEIKADFKQRKSKRLIELRKKNRKPYQFNLHGKTKAKKKNLFKKLIKDEKSVFYAADRINKTLLNKARKSFYKRDKIFYEFYLESENKNILYKNDEGTKMRILFYTTFVEQRKD